MVFWLQLTILLRASQHNVSSLGQVLIVLVLKAIITSEGVVDVVQSPVGGEVPEVDVWVQGVDGAPGYDVT